MEAELERNTNEQISKYQVRIELMEKDLAAALSRAESAEEELIELRRHIRESVDGDRSLNQSKINDFSKIPPPPPPPPPPPMNFSNVAMQANNFGNTIANHKLQQLEPVTLRKQSATGRYYRSKWKFFIY
jgi:hypothetical protein